MQEEWKTFEDPPPYDLHLHPPSSWPAGTGAPPSSHLAAPLEELQVYPAPPRYSLTLSLFWGLQTKMFSDRRQNLQWSQPGSQTTTIAGPQQVGDICDDDNFLYTIFAPPAGPSRPRGSARPSRPRPSTARPTAKTGTTTRPSTAGTTRPSSRPGTATRSSRPGTATHGHTSTTTMRQYGGKQTTTIRPGPETSSNVGFVESRIRWNLLVCREIMIDINSASSSYLNYRIKFIINYNFQTS